MSFGAAWKGGVVALVVVVLGAGASGCLNDDSSVVPRPVAPDGSTEEAGVGVYDAAGVVDGQAQPSSGDAGTDAAGPSIVGVVAGGTTSRSQRYVLTGTAGAAHAPASRSANYQLVGGMAVSTRKP